MDNLVSIERYFEIKKLAKQINKGNLTFINNASEEELVRFLRDYDNLCHNNEEKQILRNTILIPDDVDFLERYRSNKNVRLLAEYYNVPSTVIMSKLYEMQKYEPYSVNEEKKGEEDNMDLNDLEFEELEPQEDNVEVEAPKEQELTDQPIEQYQSKAPEAHVITNKVNIAEFGENTLEKVNSFISTLAKKEDMINGLKASLEASEHRVKDLEREKKQLEQKIVELEKIIFAINKVFDSHENGI